MNKSINKAYDLFKDMAFNHYQWFNERGTQKKVPGKYDVDALDLITAKVDALTQKVDKISINEWVSLLLMRPTRFVVMLAI